MSDLTTTERFVADLWEELLDCGDVGPTDDFFALGGDSIKLISMIFRIGYDLGVDLPPEAVFDAPSLRAVGAMIDAGKGQGGSAATPAGPAMPRPAGWPGA